MGCRCGTLRNAGVVDWTVEEIVSMDSKTKKVLAMNGCLHTRSNVARLYLSRKEAERGLIGVEECVKEVSKILAWLWQDFIIGLKTNSIFEVLVVWGIQKITS